MVWCSWRHLPRQLTMWKMHLSIQPQRFITRLRRGSLMSLMSHMGSRWAMGVELVQEQGLVGAMPLFRVLDAALDTPSWKEIPTLLGIGCSWSRDKTGNVHGQQARAAWWLLTFSSML